LNILMLKEKGILRRNMGPRDLLGGKVLTKEGLVYGGVATDGQYRYKLHEFVRGKKTKENGSRRPGNLKDGRELEFCKNCLGTVRERIYRPSPELGRSQSHSWRTERKVSGAILHKGREQSSHRCCRVIKSRCWGA